MDEKEHGRELMLRLQDGDDAAFTELVERYERLVLNFASRHIGDERKAEDIAQEAFLRVYKARHTWRPDASFRTWLLTIVTRLCLNELRARTRERRVMHLVSGGPEGDFWSSAVDPKGSTPADLTLARERAEIVRRAVDTLSVNQRAALLLHRFEGLSYKEVAEVLGISIGTVMSRIFNARQRLRELLATEIG